MHSPQRSWAAVARKSTKSPNALAPSKLPAAAPKPLTPSAPTTRSPPLPAQPQRQQVAFVSGHIDLLPQQFSAYYGAALDAAIQRGDAFVLSTARGADTLALAYLRTHKVDPSRITIYLNVPRAPRSANATPRRVDKMILKPEVEARYRREGYNVKIIQGYHTERDAACTAASDYDILWVRGEAETAALYGSKYRPGRISGTQKNRDRRDLQGERSGSAGLA